MSSIDYSGLTWVKSSFSNSSGGNCVEFAKLPTGEVAVRNSRFPDGPVVTYTRDEIRDFVLGVKGGEFDQFTA